MRTIIFRGKHIEDGKWVYGYLVLSQSGICSIRSIDDFLTYQVESDTIGQFTGLYDKHGREIYEWDIARVKNLIGVVTWHPNGYFCLHTRNCKIDEISYTTIGDLVDYLNREQYDDGLEVIGNIHENQEFMEGGQEV